MENTIIVSGTNIKVFCAIAAGKAMSLKKIARLWPIG